MKVILLIIALFFNCYWVWYLYTKRNCTKEITATFVGKSKFRGGSFKEEYILVFRYQYQGTEYEEKSLETYSKKKVLDHYFADNEYTILLNEKNPKYYIMEQKVQMYDITLVLAGIISAALALIF